jgi:hypothetical protein
LTAEIFLVEIATTREKHPSFAMTLNIVSCETEHLVKGDSDLNKHVLMRGSLAALFIVISSLGFLGRGPGRAAQPGDESTDYVQYLPLTFGETR